MHLSNICTRINSHTLNICNFGTVFWCNNHWPYNSNKVQFLWGFCNFELKKRWFCRKYLCIHLNLCFLKMLNLFFDKNDHLWFRKIKNSDQGDDPFLNLKSSREEIGGLLGRNQCVVWKEAPVSKILVCIYGLEK